MGVTDYGSAGDPLSAPQLAAWAADVSAVVNNSDITVDDRIAAVTATTRITRPNTDDRLVEMWNGSAWSVVDYDSGARRATSLLSGFTGIVDLRRRGGAVFLQVVVNGSAASGFDLLSLPAGFEGPGSTTVFVGSAGGTSVAPFVVTGAALSVQSTAAGIYGLMSWPAPATEVTSLPGILLTAAPA